MVLSKIWKRFIEVQNRKLEVGKMLILDRQMVGNQLYSNTNTSITERRTEQVKVSEKSVAFESSYSRSSILDYIFGLVILVSSVYLLQPELCVSGITKRMEVLICE